MINTTNRGEHDTKVMAITYCLVVFDAEQDVGSALCELTNYPSQRYFPSARSLSVARFVGRSPVTIAPQILGYLHLCMLRELRLLQAQFNSPLFACLSKRGMSVALMTSATAVVSQRAQAT
jgi:hypothetical protein